MSGFVVAICTYPKTDQYKLKKLLLSLILKPTINVNSKQISNRTLTLIKEYSGDIDRVNQQMALETNLFGTKFCTEDSIIVPTLSLKNQLKATMLPPIYETIQDKPFKEMYDALIKQGFKPVSKVSIEKIQLEILQDKIYDCKVLKEFEIVMKHVYKDIKPVYVNVFGTINKANLMVQRNICIERHKNDFIHFCDDDDLSTDFDTLLRMFEESVVIANQFKDNNLEEISKLMLVNPEQEESNVEDSKDGIIRLNGNVDKQLNITPEIQELVNKSGTIVVFKTNEKYRRGFWGTILCPPRLTFVDIHYVYQEDYRYMLKNRARLIPANDPENIYYYLSASERQYKIGKVEYKEMPEEYKYSDGKTYSSKNWK
jgi:hypothetical protein